ncbi:MAG: helix-turn-helix transcriptional regulator [Lachnospiraceae bacterium]|nr:helix-turn-helix transcriptional regulator [Lachnospiraceae bacterium]
MRLIREQQGISIRELARKVNKTPTYISDIERGNNKPPEKELMQKILAILELQETEIQNCLYDLAAQERGGVSEDIADYIMSYYDLRRAIRMAQRKKTGEQFWKECVKYIQ